VTAAPVESPWITRAATSSPTPFADAKSSIVAACTSAAAIRTGRRPTWSDSRPATSSEASTAIA